MSNIETKYLINGKVTVKAGASYRIVVAKHSIIVDLLVNPANISARDDKFILKSDDGSYETIYSILNDKKPGDGSLYI